MTDISLSDIQHWLDSLPPAEAWLYLSKNWLTPEIPFETHLHLYHTCYPESETHPDTAVMWRPDPTFSPALSDCIKELGCTSLKAFHQQSVTHPERFWQMLIRRLDIRFSKKPQKILDLSRGPEYPDWLPGARFNIVDSCFTAPSSLPAIIESCPDGTLRTWSYGQLQLQVSRIAAGLLRLNCQPGETIALMMPMHAEAVACYLAILLIGAKALPVPESFSAEEIAKRFSIGHARFVFVQDCFVRDGKEIPLYAKVKEAGAPPAIVLYGSPSLSRREDIAWESFLTDPTILDSHPCDAKTHATLLFSSGTTGTPKAIPWTHATPLKAAADGLLHHDLHQGDVIAWPTSLGWMMGPWLVFASLINHATMALYPDSPLARPFGEFVCKAGVTVLGVVPTLVAHWRQSQCLHGLDWRRIRLFTSTGECSNPEDMLYLSSRAGYVPVIEYCGGTEIGGAYVTSTLIEDNCPSVFTTPAMGSDFLLLDENGQVTDKGEVAILPPAMGMSLELLNANHHDIYYAGMPSLPDHPLLRRHGDRLQQFSSGSYRALGRHDDTMNLGGIKVSAVEIERAVSHASCIREVAAIARNDRMGPLKLVLHVVPEQEKDPDRLKALLQKEINTHLNPLFRIHEIVVVPALPKTISGKIMRKVLRENDPNHQVIKKDI